MGSVGNEPRFPRHRVAFSNFLPFPATPSPPPVLRHTHPSSGGLSVHIPAALVLFRVTAPFIFRSFALAEISRFAAGREFTSVASASSPPSPPQGKSKSLQIKEAPTRVNLPVLFEWMASLLHPIAAGSTFLSSFPSFLPSFLSYFCVSLESFSLNIDPRKRAFHAVVCSRCSRQSKPLNSHSFCFFFFSFLEIKTLEINFVR